MFKGSGLSEVYLPEGLESIGYEAFNECGLLKEINLPSTVNNIGDRAFAYSGLEGIDLPKSVTEMGEYVFTGRKLRMLISLQVLPGFHRVWQKTAQT